MFRNRDGSRRLQGSSGRVIRDCLGQSTVEYIVLVTAVIAVVILFMNDNNSGFREKLNESLDNATDGITNRAGYLSKTHYTPESTGTWSGPTSSMGVDPAVNIFH